MRMAYCVLVFCASLWALIFMTPGDSARADNWQATLHDVALPTRVVAIDKSLQKLYLFERRSPVRLMQTYPCTTGQQPGDKYATGDLRTPEGVYFLGYKIAGGLDFNEYGGIAYTLNYPNPVDRLHGKTGHGIWIHSKGHDITPLETRGCVAVNLPHITELEPLLTAGTPVVMAERVTGTLSSVQSPTTARLLKNKMQQWTKDWASRSPHMFAFYSPEDYTKAQPESFQAFKTNKERLFKMLPWIEIHNRDIHVLEGPDYWVTWTDQYYRAPNLSTEGVRRLYWQRDGKGEFRIVGMEWEPRDLGVRADVLKGALAKAPENTISDAALSPDADEARPVGVSEATQTSPIRPDEITAPERPALIPPPQNLTAAAASPPAPGPQAQPQVSKQQS
ncbi:MAG: L,D-transpeptidase family protein, partial [Betaproteobacteria bacterium]|nr:L,D-transpeptidase family protein [Betaproteobacteria bacterium]